MTKQGLAAAGTVDESLVWITGASSGIGRQLALLYAKSGYDVLASARTQSALDELVVEASELNGTIRALALDVQHIDQVENTVRDMEDGQALPGLIILNAGYYEPVGIESMTWEHFHKTVDVNYLGVVRCLTAMLPHFRQARTGHVAIVSSVAGYSGLPRAAAYGSSKAALIHLCESIKPECERDGIKLSMVNPGFVRTPLTDKNSFNMPFLLEVEDAAKRVKAGLDKHRFEVHFPRRFSLILKFLRLLPYPVYLLLTRRLLKQQDP